MNGPAWNHRRLEANGIAFATSATGAVADSVLATSEVDGSPTEEDRRPLIPLVPVETVHHLPGVDLGANHYRPTVVLYRERRELLILGEQRREWPAIYH